MEWWLRSAVYNGDRTRRFVGVVSSNIYSGSSNGGYDYPADSNYGELVY